MIGGGGGGGGGGEEVFQGILSVFCGKEVWTLLFSPLVDQCRRIFKLGCVVPRT